jgi:hypothetical protein
MVIKIRCIECKETNYIHMNHVATEMLKRSLGFEYEHIFRGQLKCSHCNENIRLLTTIFEYPKGFLNYCDSDSKSCSVISDKNDISNFAKIHFNII